MILPAISIRLFSVFAAEIDGVPVPAMRRRKSQWLLALLALRLGKEVSREWLAETLWPDSSPAYALRNLRQSLSDDIRPALGARASLLRTPTKSTLCLDATDVWVDVVAFHAAISSQKITALEHAVSLYTGPLLEDTAEEWVAQDRSACEEAFYGALEKLAADAMRRGDPGRSAGYLRRLVTSAPLRESAQIALMEALAATGDVAGVRKVYRDLRVLLHRELNTEPSPSTRALYERLRKAPVDAGPSGTLITVSDQASTMAPPSLSTDAHHMPIPLTRLIGRENDVTEVVDRLRRGRLVTVTGPGGVGKTRLSVAVADAVGAEFPHGIWFVELAALSEPELVANTVAQALQIKEQQGKTSTETLITALISRSLLLVLDNCEHLLDSCAKLTESLLSRCAGVRILATSREAMGLYGEWVYPLPGLEVPPLSELAVSTPSTYKPKNLTAHLSEYTAVRLFVERAAAQNRSLRISERDALTIAEICVSLDGLPLAIEMAAARVRSMSLNEVLSRLSDRFGLLRSGSRMALPRQQTLQALIDWSYDLLNDSEQTLLRRLSVFAGQWTLEATEAICHSEQNVSQLLGSLVDKSLLVLHTDDGDMRYSMLESTSLNSDNYPSC